MEKNFNKSSVKSGDELFQKIIRNERENEKWRSGGVERWRPGEVRKSEGVEKWGRSEKRLTVKLAEEMSKTLLRESRMASAFVVSVHF